MNLTPLPKGSTQIAARNAAVIPGGTASGARLVERPLVIRSASGADLIDEEGRRYIDLNCAFGATLLGHCDAEHRERVAELSRDIDLVGIGTTALEGELAERLTTLIPCAEMVAFCCSGTEATYHALRLARAATGRRLLVKFQGAYHGWHDYVATNYMSSRDHLGAPDPISAGILPESVAATLILPFNDVERLEALFAERGDEIAAVIVEPVMHNVGSIRAEPAFLQALRGVTEAAGSVLVFDEIITGFRHALGGYQSICGVTPDLATFGKAIGNGYPISLIAGRASLMRRFGPRAAGGDVLLGGTFNAHPQGVAAGIATIERMARPGAYERLFDLGERLRAGFEQAAIRTGAPMTVAGYGSVISPAFVTGPVRRYEDLVDFDAGLDLAFRSGLLDEGIACSSIPLRRFTISLAHDEARIDAAVAAAEAVLTRLVGHDAG